MAGVSRMLHLSSRHPHQFNCMSSSSYLNSGSSSSSTSMKCLLGKAGVTGEKEIYANREKKLSVAVKASTASKSMISLEPQTKNGISLLSLLANATETALRILRHSMNRRRSWKLQAEMLMEKTIIDCRFFTLFAVAGSLMGSILCFVEGCFLILESYFNYFHMMMKHSDHGHVIDLLMEAIDMFLVGTAMLIFGMGLYVLFVGSNYTKMKGTGLIPRSNFFGLFQLKMLPAWVEMQSISQAKSKIGHAVLMILQVGVLEKFKNIPLVTGLDLACFAGAIIVSSACIFLLSRLSMDGTKDGR
ncbi:uncharacterized protein LOC122658186 [Telopea speciosissima]|uniref:uncharacterized protein LOC122658186 n=1 Tax=Telopea speciosissima TaxID=54955 RepID=UPI001CC5D39D|nr:uncharacterized protein LOC122658186 [Telopea speciosissima]